MDPATFRLTQLSHGGGCGCKIAPAKLHEILKAVKLDAGVLKHLRYSAQCKHSPGRVVWCVRSTRGTCVQRLYMLSRFIQVPVYTTERSNSELSSCKDVVAQLQQSYMFHGVLQCPPTCLWVPALVMMQLCTKSTSSKQWCSPRTSSCP